MYDVIEYIIMYGEEPQSAKKLSQAFGYPDATIRRFINQARLEGIPICSCSKGYYYSESKEKGGPP